MTAKMERTRTVTILLTRYTTLFSRFICGISKNHYSHAAISIDENEELFYSFNCKGFVVEKPKKRKPRTQRAGSICIRMQVPESTYALIKRNWIISWSTGSGMVFPGWGWHCACCIFRISLGTDTSARSLWQRFWRGRVRWSWKRRNPCICPDNCWTG